MDGRRTRERLDDAAMQGRAGASRIRTISGSGSPAASGRSTVRVCEWDGDALAAIPGHGQHATAGVEGGFCDGVAVLSVANMSVCPATGGAASKAVEVGIDELTPRIPASADALVRDRKGRLLILKPTYKSGWTIPAGLSRQTVKRRGRPASERPGKSASCACAAARWCAWISYVHDPAAGRDAIPLRLRHLR
jgi:hypothetical protein